MSDKYSASVVWSEEDGCFIATVPEIERLSAFGDTASEALAELEIAKELMLEAFREKGVPLPEPRQASTFSGQVRLRMPKSLHASLAEEAASEGVSLNTYMVTLLSGIHEVTKQSYLRRRKMGVKVKPLDMEAREAIKEHGYHLRHAGRSVEVKAIGDILICFAHFERSREAAINIGKDHPDFEEYVRSWVASISNPDDITAALRKMFPLIGPARIPVGESYWS